MQRKGYAQISNPTTWKRPLHKSSHQWAIHRPSNRPASISNYSTDKPTMSTPLFCSLIRSIRGNHTNNTPMRIQTLNFKILPPSLTFTVNLIRLPWCTKVHRNPNSSSLVINFGLCDSPHAYFTWSCQTPPLESSQPPKPNPSLKLHRQIDQMAMPKSAQNTPFLQAGKVGLHTYFMWLCQRLQHMNRYGLTIIHPELWKIAKVPAESGSSLSLT
jgi:hypothetical protein